ncbi:MAG: hypothetical protein ABEH43_07940, partial [Flavobacteriales bacterium]
MVEVPAQTKMEPFKQELQLKMKNGKESLVIKNKFDEKSEGGFQEAIEAIKEKAELNENYDEELE